MPYEADEDGVLRPVLPSHCVFGRGAGGSETCSVYVDHYRCRKTGPCFALAVVGCSTHPDGRYTLYPPGHYPYGRQAVAPYSPSGALLLDWATRRPAWESTVFGAAVDAAGGQRWPSDSPWNDRRRRRTQGRRLEFAARLLGVHPGLDEGARERIATRLGVATLILLGAVRRWGTNWRDRGGAILAVLLALPLEASLLDRIGAAGAMGGLWPEPRRWEAARGDPGTWVFARSPHPEHPTTSSPRSRSPPPTTLPGAATAGPAPSSES
jgi:hypothetical protein